MYHIWEWCYSIIHHIETYIIILYQVLLTWELQNQNWFWEIKTWKDMHTSPHSYSGGIRLFSLVTTETLLPIYQNVWIQARWYYLIFKPISINMRSHWNMFQNFNCSQKYQTVCQKTTAIIINWKLQLNYKPTPSPISYSI